MNKREFLLATGGALLVGDVWSAPVSPNAASAAPRSRRSLFLRDHSLAAWRGRIGESFVAMGDEGGGLLLLERILVQESDPSMEQFSLVFSTADPVFRGTTHVLRHRIEGQFGLYLDDAGLDPAGRALLRADCCRLS